MACPLFLFSSCATEDRFLYLNKQVVALNGRVDSLQSGQMQIRERQAEANADTDKIREEMLGLSGRLDENNRLIKRSIEGDTTEQHSSAAEIKSHISKLETEIARLHAYLGLERRTAVQEQSLRLKQAKPGETGPQVPTIKEPKVSPEKRLYDLNFDLYRGGKYKEAISGFKNFVKKYPKSDLADNAQFWVGEAYMSLKQYEEAILAYQKVIRKYPRGNKVPNAILRQALAFYEIKDRTSAKLLLQKLIKKYPKSSEASIAKTKLKTIK